MDQEWLAWAVEATAERASTGLHGSAAIVVGKETILTIEVADGRISGPATGHIDCQVPLTPSQVEAYLGGDLSPSVAYMRGDVKPTGSGRAILAVLDALEAGRPVSA